MTSMVQIEITEYDADHVFYAVKKGNRNLFMELGVCDFASEMDYYGLPCEAKTFHAEGGYVFDKSIPEECVRREIERFVKHYKL